MDSVVEAQFLTTHSSLGVRLELFVIYLLRFGTPDIEGIVVLPYHSYTDCHPRLEIQLDLTQSQAVVVK